MQLKIVIMFAPLSKYLNEIKCRDSDSRKRFVEKAKILVTSLPNIFHIHNNVKACTQDKLCNKIPNMYIILL